MEPFMNNYRLCHLKLEKILKKYIVENTLHVKVLIHMIQQVLSTYDFFSTVEKYLAQIKYVVHHP